MKHSLIVSVNPNSHSLTVKTAQLCYDTLQQHSKKATYLYLDKIEFNPLITQEEIQRRITFDVIVLEHQKLLRSASTLVLFFPDWFGFPPALLVGWLQRVFAPGIAFEYVGQEFETKKKKGLLDNLTVILAISTDEAKESDGVTYSTLLLQKRIFSYCSITNIQSIVLYDTHNITQKQRKAWIERCKETCITYA